METAILLWILAAVLVLVGMAGLFFPAVPGAIVLFAGLAVAAWADNFFYVGWKTLTLLGVLALFVAGMPYPLAALVGASLLVLVGRVPPRLVFAEVDWTLLLFFAGLFIVMGAFEKAGYAARLLAWSHPWFAGGGTPALLGLAASLIAVKEALDLEWMQTIIVVVMGGVIIFIVAAIGAAIVAALGYAAGAARGALGS